MAINVLGLREALSLKFEPKWFELVRGFERRGAIKKMRLVAPTYVGVTGSCGKTTTASLLGEVLKKGYHHKLQLGVANNQERYAYRSLRKMPADTQTVVQELHGGEAGGLDYLVEHIPVDVAIITAIGREHVKAFSEIEAIAREKAKLITALVPGGVACLNIDSEPVAHLAKECRPDVKCLTVSATQDADFRAEIVTSNWKERLCFTLKFGGRAYKVKTRFVGTIALTNVLLVLAAIHSMGLDLEPALSVISQFEPVDSRMNLLRANNGQYFLMDCFKASLWSAKMLAQDLPNIKSGPLVFVLGQLSETGSGGSVRYRQYIKSIEQHCDIIIGTSGALSSVQKRQDMDPSGKFFACETIGEIASEIAKHQDALVVLKSSKIAKLSRVVEAIKAPITCQIKHCPMVTGCNTCPMLRA